MKVRRLVMLRPRLVGFIADEVDVVCVEGDLGSGSELLVGCGWDCQYSL